MKHPKIALGFQLCLESAINLTTTVSKLITTKINDHEHAWQHTALLCACLIPAKIPILPVFWGLRANNLERELFIITQKSNYNIILDQQKDVNHSKWRDSAQSF